jgi:hypothetical protein
MENGMDSPAWDLDDGEVISPELVLVDPELAQIARRRLPEVREWRPQPLPPASSALPVAPARRRVAGKRTIGVRALATAITLLALGQLTVPSVLGALIVQHPAAPVAPTRSEVEARTLALLQEGKGARTAPHDVLDPRSGRLAQSAHIVCSRVERTSLFDCRLGVGHSPGRTWLLTVAVERDGTEKLTWNGSVSVP